MMVSGRRWAVRDRYGNEIYITNERWEHIIFKQLRYDCVSERNRVKA